MTSTVAHRKPCLFEIVSTWGRGINQSVTMSFVQVKLVVMQAYAFAEWDQLKKRDISSHSICFSVTHWYANILWNVMQVQFQSPAEMCIKLEAFFVISVMFSVTAQARFYWCSSCESQWGVSARKKTSSEKHILTALFSMVCVLTHNIITKSSQRRKRGF